MSSSAAFHARTLAQQAKARVFALARALVCGSSSRVLLASFDRDLFCWKTSQLSLPGMAMSLLDRLPKWGMTHDGGLYERPTPEPHTSAHDGSAWPTPQTRDFRHGSPPDSDRMQRKAEQGWSANLNDAALWPTPNTVDAKGGSRLGAGQKQLTHQAAPLAGQQLNPDWVEALMGFPPGWSDPTNSYTSRDLGSLNTPGSHPASPIGAIIGRSD